MDFGSKMAYHLNEEICIMGEWDTSNPPIGKVVIRMTPPPAKTYGFWNESTRLCIEEMKRRVKPGMSFFDFGTGTGILAAVAYHLGASPIYATELVVPVANYAKGMWELNNIPVEFLEEEFPPVDICVANIGDQLWDLDYKAIIRSGILINISNRGKVIVDYASTS